LEAIEIAELLADALLFLVERHGVIELSPGVENRGLAAMAYREDTVGIIPHLGKDAGCFCESIADCHGLVQVTRVCQ
jgi:hypothetical protein